MEKIRQWIQNNRRIATLLAAVAALAGALASIQATWNFFSSEPLAAVFLRNVESMKKIVSNHLREVTLFGGGSVVGAALVLLYGFLRKKEKPRAITVEQLKDQQISIAMFKWICKWLSNDELKVKHAILFGSMVHDHYPTSDVDLLLLFLPMEDNTFSRISRAVKQDIRQDFSKVFGPLHPLHVQILHASEEAKGLPEFLSKAGRYESLELIRGDQQLESRGTR
jgi:predicted nucleotidyltransferase